MALAARSLKENGASRTYALVSHGVSSLSSLCFLQVFIGNRPLLRGKHGCHRESSVGNASRKNLLYPDDKCLLISPVNVGNKYNAST